MHEVSLNQVITDYLTGESIELTTYEDLRQSLARLLVEEKGYPTASIKQKYPLELALDNQNYTINVDFVVYINELPALIMGFCPGAVSTFITQYICLARIFPQGPVPFLIVTDTKDAALIEVATKKEICRGFHCIPAYEKLSNMFSNQAQFKIDPMRLEKDKRVAYALFALSDSCCSSSECAE